jgi:hypothetical protein
VAPLPRPPVTRRRAVAVAAASSSPSPSSSTADAAADPDQVAEETVRAGWDPEGLFGGSGAGGNGGSSGDLFARQQARRAAAAAAAAAAAEAEAAKQQQQQQRAAPQPAPVFDEPPVAVPSAWRATSADPSSSPPLVADLSAEQRAELATAVAGVFPTLDLSHPGMRVLHLRPPVLSIDGFASPEDCEAWMREAEASGRLATSRVGAGHAGGGGGGEAATSVSYDAAQRTSTNLLVDPATRKAAPVLGLLADAFQERALALLDSPNAAAADADATTTTTTTTAAHHHHHRPGASWGVPGRMPLPRQYTFEAPQVTRYLPPEAAAGRARGQLFGAHEDAFPRVVARANGFQRHATLLLYLNGRAPTEGGATCFLHLCDREEEEEEEEQERPLAVTPNAGRLLIFFPSADDGTPDARTLHAAEEVTGGGAKWVMQQWVARGYVSPSALRQQQHQSAASAPTTTAAAATAPTTLTRKERRERARQEAAAAKGAGSRKKKA